MTTRGTIGNIGLYSEDVPFDHIRINSGMLIFRSNKHALLPSYLFELLRSEIVKDQIRKETTGAAQPQLPIKTLVMNGLTLAATLGVVVLFSFQGTAGLSLPFEGFSLRWRR